MDMGKRIAERIDAFVPSMTRKEFAARVEMAPDALSRALNGQRGFSSLEVARIADALGADVYELITGLPDPNTIRVAARHDFDHATSERSVPTFESDSEVLEEIGVVYAQAGLPAREHKIHGLAADDVRELLGEGFVRPFIDRIEDRLHIDVVRVSGLGTAYTLDVAGRTCIAIPAVGSWFRENWDLAHELAHAAGLLSEADANAFAAALLLPEPLVRSVEWDCASQEAIADFVWATGVSTMSLKIRLDKLRIGYRDSAHVLTGATQAVLRRARSWSSEFGDEITSRMAAAGARRFPIALQEAHERGIESGRLGPGYLAWMRGVPPAMIEEAYSPPVDEPDVAEVAAAFGLSVV